MLLLAVLLTPAAHAIEPEMECGEFDAPIQGRYCIYTTAGSTNHDVIHYFHGSGGNERSWVNESSLFRAYHLRNYWDVLKIEAPVVISVSFGPSWSLVELNNGINPQYLQKYVNSILPMLESKLTFQLRRRMLLGMSMGGANVAQLILKHPKLFSKAALISPAIVDIAPTNSNFISHMVEVNGAEYGKMVQFQTKMSEKIPDEASWEAFSSLDLGKIHLGPSTPELLIEVGTRDPWGFYFPALRFSQLAKSNGCKSTFIGTDGGGHGDVDYFHLAKFLGSSFEH